MDLIVIPNELEDGDVEPTCEGHAVLCHADGAVLNVWTPRDRKREVLKEFKGLQRELNQHCWAL